MGALDDLPDEVRAELRALADDASGGRAWIEKIHVRSRMPEVARAAPDPNDPIAECTRLAGELQAEPAALHAFADGTLRDLLAKLPPALRSGPQSIGLEDPEVLAGLVREAESLLLDRLAGSAQ